MANRLPLSDVLENITEELIKADEIARRRGSAAMRFSECELEFAVEAEKSGEAGIKVWVLELGGEIKRSESNTIKLKFISLDNPLVAKGLTPEPLKKPKRQPTKRAR